MAEKSTPERTAYKRRLGATLSRLRTAIDPDLTQAIVAERFDVDPETVGRWERGTREPKAYDLHRLARHGRLDHDGAADATRR